MRGKRTTGLIVTEGGVRKEERGARKAPPEQQRTLLTFHSKGIKKYEFCT